MAIEHELKVLDIDLATLKAAFKRRGITKQKKLHFRRYIFDTVPFSEKAWVRLRTDGQEATLTYKKSLRDAIDGMQEIEVIVSDFDATKDLLEASGLVARSYQENKRDVYDYQGCELTIDYWPLIPPYLEIEAQNSAAVRKCLIDLGLDQGRTTSLPTADVYSQYGIDISQMADLRF